MLFWAPFDVVYVSATATKAHFHHFIQTQGSHTGENYCDIVFALRDVFMCVSVCVRVCVYVSLCVCVCAPVCVFRLQNAMHTNASQGDLKVLKTKALSNTEGKLRQTHNHINTRIHRHTYTQTHKLYSNEYFITMLPRPFCSKLLNSKPCTFIIILKTSLGAHVCVSILTLAISSQEQALAK